MRVSSRIATVIHITIDYQVTITVLMSHSQFRCVKTYTETYMAKSLRQAYDYWQDQPGFSLLPDGVRCLRLKNSTMVNVIKQGSITKAIFTFR